MSTATRPRLPRTVYLLGWVSLLADISGEMLYPLIPLFVTGVLGAPKIALGTIEGCAEAVASLLKGISGWHSDRIGRRTPYVRWGYAIPVAGKTLVAIATGWGMVLAGRMLDRFGKGIRTSPRDALIADAVGRDDRGRAFGFHRAMDTVGAVLGSLFAVTFLVIAGIHGEATPGDAPAYRIALLIAAAFGLLSVVVTFLLREPRRPASPDGTASREGTASPDGAASPAGAPRLHRFRSLGRGYWCAVAMLLVFGLANSSDTFLLLRAHDLGLSPMLVVLAYALFNGFYALLSYPVGALSDRVGRWRIVAAGWAVYAIVYAGFAWVSSPAAVWPLLALYGCYMALTEGVGKAIVSDFAPPGRRGEALGIFTMGLGFANLAASIAAGVLWDRVGPGAAFWLGSGAAIAALLMLPFVAAQTRAHKALMGATP